jgi:two-component system, OmpR family, response regulator
MLPHRLALIDDDPEFSEYLGQHLRERGVDVRVFTDANALLADTTSNYDFYLVDLMLPGVDGVQLVDIIRRRSDAGILVVSGRLGPEVFATVMKAGADMHLVKPVQFEQVLLAIEAIWRRSGRNSVNSVWTLDRSAGELVAPDGSRVPLSEIDLGVLECFVEASGQTVSREVLRDRLGRTRSEEAGDGLNAVIYRLRRRIERATPALVPLQSRSRVGYVFKATLRAL